MKKVHLITFGCQMNRADSEVALARLANAGWTAVSNEDEADLLIFNTCSVREGAEDRVRGRLGSLKRRKKDDPAFRIAVMGCMAQRAGEKLLADFPHLDLVIGTEQFVLIDELLERVRHQGPLAITGPLAFDDQSWGAQRSSGVNAWIPVMRGCNYRCTYCIVPFTRGREKSRPLELIAQEVEEAVADGHAQVTLLGQTVDAYGKTLGDGSTLAGLLHRIHDTPGLQRIRFVTSHPKDVTDGLLEAMRDLPKVASHLHAPAQSGSSRILRLMGRRYDRDGYLRFVDRARAILPTIEIQNDMIVGFPSETDADHADSVSLLEHVRFSGSFVFMYSPRPGTHAMRLEDDVPAPVKKARCNELLERQLAIQEADNQRCIGQTYEVLVEGPSKSNPDRYQGRSQGNRNVVFPANDPGLVGRIVPVTILRATNLTLYGEETL